MSSLSLVIMKSIEQALVERQQHPGRSLRAVCGDDIPKSTLHDRESGRHAPRGVNGNRLLTVVEEGLLLEKINEGAMRGTLLTPRHIQELAERLGGRRAGKNWPTTFLQRHKDKINAKYFTIQEIARINADTTMTRRAFWELVSGLSRIELILRQETHWEVDNTFLATSTTWTRLASRSLRPMLFEPSHLEELQSRHKLPCQTTCTSPLYLPLASKMRQSLRSSSTLARICSTSGLQCTTQCPTSRQLSPTRGTRIST